jgi:hypothetical protein
MKKQFAGFYPPSANDFKKLWGEATFVLDTNVLLNLYRYPEKAREDLLGIFENIKARLWLPYQVALEYHRNRPLVIAEQKGRFAEVNKLISGGITSIENGLSKLQLRDRHSSINPDPLMAAIKPLVDKYLAELDAQEKSHVSVYGADPLQERLEVLLANKIGPKPSQAVIDEIYKQGAERYKNEVPPGFCDEKEKSDAPKYSYDGVTYTPKFGDLVLWKQINDYAKENKKAFIIFITDDEKEDWWWKVKSQGERNLGPHPCLTAEIAQEAGVTHFYMYNSGQFLKYAKQYLGAKISDESIDQVKDIEKARKRIISEAERTAQHSRRIRNVMRQLLKEVRPYNREWSAPSINPSPLEESAIDPPAQDIILPIHLGDQWDPQFGSIAQMFEVPPRDDDEDER